MQTTLNKLIVASAAAIMVAACSARQADSTSPNVTGDRLGSTTVAGSWVNVSATVVPLYRESMTLTQSGDRVTGKGTYAMEAGRTGPTTIDGTLVGSSLTLTITRDYGLVETFTGKLTDAKHLSGNLVIENSKQSIAYAKQ